MKANFNTGLATTSSASDHNRLLVGRIWLLESEADKEIQSWRDPT
jgi:hypothetical protein